jgi:hypothetical protein
MIGGVLEALPFVPAINFTADRVAISVTTAGASGANVDIALYASDAGGANPAAYIATLGNVVVDTTGTKELTISRAFVAGTLLWIVIKPSANVGLRSFVLYNYPSFGNDQSETLDVPVRCIGEWNGGTIGSAWTATEHSGRSFAVTFRRSA